METKFKKGDLVRIRATKETVMVVEYKVDHTGDVLNALGGGHRFPSSVVTEEVLCEGRIDNKFQRRYISEANLEPVSME